jgi:hypothetical protein
MVMAGLLAAAIPFAGAQTAPTTLFQLDGNAASSGLTCNYAGGAGACDYWNLLNGSGNNSATGGVGTGSSAGHSLVRTFINGSASTNSFQGGGSKDPLPLSQWKYSSSPTPNKDTLNAGYAAGYQAPNKDFVVVFGADRLSPNGDANIGIWFFQQQVGPNGSGGFTGKHVNGDIFVISSFTGGGGTSSIGVFSWNSSCTTGVKNPQPGQCADANLTLVATEGASQVCGTSAYCAITNTAATATTWEGPIAAPLFFEGGVNITAALASLGNSLPCFSSFLEETRTSQTTSAVLKDFLAGTFPVCSMHVTKACDTQHPPVLVNNGTQVQYTWTGTVQNTGIGTVDSVEVEDTLPDASLVHPALMLNGSTVTSLGQGDVGTFSATYTTAALTATNKVTAKAFFGSTEIDADNTDSATCMETVSTAVKVIKHCVAPGPGLSCSSAGCVVQVPISAQVCNKGTVRLTSVTLSDSPSATLTGNPIAVLNPAGTADGSDCANVTGSYQPTAFTAASDGKTNGRYSFADIVSVTSATPALGGALQPIASGMCQGSLACAPVECPLCSSGECSGTLP